MKERGIDTLIIVTEPKEVDGKFGVKPECEVSFQGQTEDDPHSWTLNKKSTDALIDKFGTDSKKWMGSKIPIETAPTEKGRAIYVDTDKLNKKEEVDQGKIG